MFSVYSESLVYFKNFYHGFMIYIISIFSSLVFLIF